MHFVELAFGRQFISVASAAASGTVASYCACKCSCLAYLTCLCNNNKNFIGVIRCRVQAKEETRSRHHDVFQIAAVILHEEWVADRLLDVEA
jgi:hypothetical protein